MSKAEEFRKRLVPEEKENQLKKTMSTFKTVEQEKLFEKAARYSRSTVKKLWVEGNKRDKIEKVIPTPIFATKEQEELFFECAKKSMSTETRLHWDGEHDDDDELEL